MRQFRDLKNSPLPSPGRGLQLALCGACLAGLAFSAGTVAQAQHVPQATHTAAPARIPWSDARLQVGYTPPPGYRFSRITATDDVMFRGEAADGLRNILVLHVMKAKVANLEKLSTDTLLGIKRRHPDLRVIQKSGTQEGRVSCYRTDYAFQMQIKGKPHLLKMRQLLVNHAGRTIDFTLAAAPAVFPHEAAALDKSLADLKWSVP